MNPGPESPSRGFLLVLTGPSGAGKGTVMRRILNLHPDVELSVSATTRKPREGEVNGREYYFLDVEQFTQYRERGEFLEWAQVYDNFYGTPKTHVLERLSAGQVIVLEIDTQGAKTIMEQGFPELVTVFLTPSQGQDLVERLRTRGSEGPADMTRRLRNAPLELLDLPLFDYLVLNDDVEEAVKALSAIVIAEQHRVPRFRGKVDLVTDFAGRSKAPHSRSDDEGTPLVTP